MERELMPGRTRLYWMGIGLMLISVLCKLVANRQGPETLSAVGWNLSGCLACFAGIIFCLFGKGIGRIVAVLAGIFLLLAITPVH